MMKSIMSSLMENISQHAVVCVKPNNNCQVNFPEIFAWFVVVAVLSLDKKPCLSTSIAMMCVVHKFQF